MSLQVTSVEYFWRFVNVTLLPNLYPTRWYNGDKKGWRDRNFLTDGQSFRVGPARLRQIRMKEGEKLTRVGPDFGTSKTRRTCS